MTYFQKRSGITHIHPNKKQSSKVGANNSAEAYQGRYPSLHK
jgi:hypothetical protein